MVLRAIPVVRATGTLPTRPAARASPDANKRRSLSLRNGPSALWRARMASWSIIRPGWTPRHPIRIDYSESFVALLRHSGVFSTESLVLAQALREQFVTPPEATAAFVAAMEDVLE